MAKTFTYSDQQYELRFTYGPAKVAIYWCGKVHIRERLRTCVGLFGPFMSADAYVTHNGSDLFDFEVGRKAALRKLMDMIPGADSKGLRKAIWDAYLDRKADKYEAPVVCRYCGKEKET